MLHNNAAQQRHGEKPASAPKASQTIPRAQGGANILISTEKTREFQTQLLHYFSKSDNKSNHHHAGLLDDFDHGDEAHVPDFLSNERVELSCQAGSRHGVLVINEGFSGLRQGRWPGRVGHDRSAGEH